TIIDGDFNGDDAVIRSEQNFWQYNNYGDNTRTLIFAVLNDSSYLFDGILFRAGQGGRRGGAILASGNDSTVEIRRCVFVDNRLDSEIRPWDGGGAINSSADFLVIDSCVFLGNQAFFRGGAIAVYTAPPGENCDLTGDPVDALVVNSVFSGNQASEGGAAVVYACGGAEVMCRFVNCTFAGNKAAGFGSAVTTLGWGSAEIVNSVVFGNRDVPLHPGSPQWQLWRNPSDFGTLFVDHCIVESVLEEPSVIFGSFGRLNVNPEFFDARGEDGFAGTADDNLRVSSTSEAVEMGSEQYLPSGVTTDIDGVFRIIDGDGDMTPSLDMGAYEAQPGCPTCPGARVWVEPMGGSFHELSNWDVGVPL
ncbi:MAG: hypothetical protein VX528_11015, partial [Candidatus Latescibacterota bacterium]|nr:hypothetical protein [Candidatus Latescibacterota bacterium]